VESMSYTFNKETHGSFFSFVVSCAQCSQKVLELKTVVVNAENEQQSKPFANRLAFWATPAALTGAYGLYYLQANLKNLAAYPSPLLRLPMKSP